MFDYSMLIAPVATVVAAGLGAYFSGRVGQHNAETGWRQTRRHELADAAIASALALRTALHESDPEWTAREWERVLGNTYDALDAAKPILPRQMLHLRRSIRDACGEAWGAVAVFDLGDIDEQLELTEFDPRWTAYARDYTGVAIEALQRWREAKERDAVNVGAPTYDDWLRATGRYHRS
ncbi:MULTISPECIES: hypothetical protein [unclassified Microbacterium]|uniref:hypothetical protein n=1 Tax=unclassified Microbacterium TaxID=2609290 RepID=UPI00364F24A9